MSSVIVYSHSHTRSRVIRDFKMYPTASATTAVIPTMKQNINTDIKKLGFNADRLFVQRLRDKPENKKLTIIIKYIFSL